MTIRDKKRQAGQLLLGDRVELAMKKTGIQSIVKTMEKMTGFQCGCERRRARLNAWSQGQPIRPAQ